MKYKLFNLFLGITLLFGVAFIPVTHGDIINMGGGSYYNTETGMNSTNSSGTCGAGDICAATTNEFNAARTGATEASVQAEYARRGGTTIAPTGVVPANSCLPGTMSGSIYNGGSGQCQALINGQTTLITYCTGTETSGPCSPKRINGTAAANAALEQSIRTNQPCQAQIVGFPGVDTNTGLNYYYNVSCGRSGGGSVSGGGSTGVSIGSTALQSSLSSSPQSTTAYVNALLNIVRSMVATSKAAISKNTSITSSVSAVSSSRLQQIISQANTLSYGALTTDERMALTNYLTTNRTALIDQNFQTFKPGSVFAWALSMGTGIVPNAETLSLGFTTFNSATQLFVKTTGAISVGVKTSNFSYTFTKVGNSWKVTLDNVALGVPTDFFYIPANYSITAISSADLNNQNQYRFNLMSYFPGTPAGNTFYSEMFSAFTAAYYDWNNQTKASASELPTNSLTSQTLEQMSITFPATIMVNVNTLNVRSSLNTQGAPIKQLAKGNTFIATSLVKGESVEGTDKWWVTTTNNTTAYIWAGGTIMIP